jgi:hypothetical protein
MVSTREDLPLVSLSSQYSSCYYRGYTNVLENSVMAKFGLPKRRAPEGRIYEEP